MIRIKLTDITPRIKSFLVVGVTLFPVGVIFFFSLLFIYFPTFRNMNQVVHYAMEEILPVVELENAMLRAAMPPNDFLIHGDRAERENFGELSRQIEKQFQEAINLSQSAKNQEELDLIRSAWYKARATGEELLQDEADDSMTAGEKMEVFDADIGQVVDELALMRLALSAKIREQHALTMRLITKGIYVAIIAFVLALAGGILASILFTVDRRQLKKMSYLDALTGLYNRRSFDKKMDYATKRVVSFEKSVFAFLLLDIDHFKKVNDTYGHEAGDIVLRDVAKVIKQNARSTDFVSRHGGEEFAIIIPTTQIDEVGFVANRIRRSVAETVFRVGDETELHITISGGYAFFPLDAKVKEKLFKCADQALYAAKEGGRNQVVNFASLPLTKKGG